MKIAQVGFYTKTSKVKQVSFHSKTMLIDFDVLFMDLNFITNYQYIQGMSRISDINGKYLNGQDFNKLRNDIDRRNQEIKLLLEMGRSVFLLTPPPITFRVESTNIDLFSLFTFANFKTIEGEGNNIEFRGDKIFLPFWNKNKDVFEYRAYFNEFHGKPLFYIKDTNFVIATYSKVEKGHLIFLPAIKVSTSDAPEHLNAFFDSSIDLLKCLEKQEVEKVNLPKWSRRYKMPGSDSLDKELLVLEESLVLLQQQMKSKKCEIENIESQKNLFTGTGKSLEIEVRKVFESLGFSVEEAEDNRDDLILTYEDHRVVVEIKGVKNSSAEKHAAQLEKWVNIYYEKNDIKPKGILVVNAYNDRPLEERTEPAFPNQMLKFSIAREHCLITGLQLLCLYLDCKDDEAKRKTAINDILSTNGVFDKYQDWSKFIHKVEDKEKEN